MEEKRELMMLERNERQQAREQLIAETHPLHPTRICRNSIGLSSRDGG
jgi:hypothetical protein